MKTAEETISSMCGTNARYNYAQVTALMEAYADQIKSESEATIENLASKVVELEADTNTMFNALFAIISNEEINDLPKCMAVANEAINNLVGHSRV